MHQLEEKRRLQRGGTSPLREAGRRRCDRLKQAYVAGSVVKAMSSKSLHAESNKAMASKRDDSATMARRWRANAVVVADKEVGSPVGSLNNDSPDGRGVSHLKLLQRRQAEEEAERKRDGTTAPVLQVAPCTP